MVGQTISHYKILDKLGEGGMGVVYRAHDTKLERDVALKFLPPHLSASAQDKTRFIQEAKAASALNHPNICTIHAIEDIEGQLFIVMEFVDGQILREKQGTLSSGKAVDIGIQIAEGLAAAHEKGVVHRDIKPENIMIRRDGIAQIMDFGLAKLRASGSKITRLTKEGSTVGTAGYMSPEQVQGQDADHRSDIFSLGVLLYELFTGELPFKGVHETALMYEIVNVDPAPMSAVKQDLDPELDRIVLECLQKEPDERYNSVKDIAKDLKRFKRESGRQRVSRVTTARPAIRAPQAAEPGHASARRWNIHPGYVVSAVLALLALLLAWSPWRGDIDATRPVVRFSVELPENAFLRGASSAIAVSPDGKSFVYEVATANEIPLYIHRMDQRESLPLPGTEGALEPAFSPDGQWIVFNLRRQQLVKMSLSGGAPELICPIQTDTRGISWAADNTIFFGVVNDAVYRVPASGGTPVAVTTLDTSAGEISHRFPHLLPDGKTVIFTVKHNNITTFNDAVIAAQRLDNGERITLVRGGTFAKYIPTGYLMYMRGSSILAAPFDADRPEVTGPAVPVEEGGYLLPGSGQANVDFSKNGILVFAPIGPISSNAFSLIWMDRLGAAHTLLDTLRPYSQAALSPDGQKVALGINAANNDIWVYHISRNVLTRLTFGGGNNDLPIWSPDGKYIVYSAEKGRTLNLFRKRWDGGGKEERLTRGTTAQVAGSFAPDGNTLSFDQGGDIWVLPLDTSGTGRLPEPRPFIQTTATETFGMFSPDGGWMAYTSDESGKREVYVTAFPSGEGKWQISNGGGEGFAWSRDGKELFYRSGNTLMAVRIQQAATFDFSVPRMVCSVPAGVTLWDVSADGKRFLGLYRQRERAQVSRLEVVTEWFDVVKAKMAEGGP